jgi:HprK-related kinase A
MTTVAHAEPLIAAALPDAALFRRFRIGPFEVAVRTCLPEALEDLTHLYRHCRLPDQPRDALDRARTIVVEAQPQKWLGWAGWFAIWADGKPLFQRRRRRELLPYLEWAINWQIIATRHEYVQLHAATLAHRGRGVILAGLSSAGKSTLAAALIARGWQYLCDEFALIEPHSGQLTPFPKALCVKAGSFPIIRALGLPLWEGRHYVKAFKGRVAYISPADLGAERLGAACPIHAVVLPQYTGRGEPRIRPLPRAEALIELGQLAFNRHIAGRRCIEVLTAAVRSAACFRLDSGDIDRTCDLLETSLK